MLKTPCSCQLTRLAALLVLTAILFFPHTGTAEPQGPDTLAPLSVLKNVSPDEEGPFAIRQWNIRVSTYFHYGAAWSWKGLEKFCNEYTQSKGKQADGRWVIDTMMEAFRNYFRNSGAQGQWEEDSKRLQDWRNAYPKSVCAPIVESIFWRTYGWNARGTDYANTVTPEGWKLFHERTEKAGKILDETKEISDANPSWYKAKINSMQDTNEPISEMLKLTIQGLQKFPDYFQSTFAMANAITPQWGGSWELVDSFASTITNLTQKVQKRSLYARIYWYLSEPSHTSVDIFKESLVKWDLMRNGFEDLMAMTPNSAWNLNNYISFACQAGDKSTYLKLRPRITKKTYYHDAWANNNQIDVCDLRFGANNPL